MGSQYYKKYTKAVKEEKPSYIKLFFGAFFMMLILFIVMAVHLFSSVDTAIGENDEGDLRESGLGVKHLIDSRLKFIQMEDANQLPSNYAPKIIQSKEEEMSLYNTDSSEDEVQFQTFDGKNVSTIYGNNNRYSSNETSFSSPVKPQTENSVKAKPPVYKVYIGSYYTIEQARTAQSIVQDANLGITSFVKTLNNGTYTIQVGSYNDKEKAQSLTAELQSTHFPARMVEE